MKMKYGKKTEIETICWDCQNYSRCSWSRGKPVKGWKATPTRIEETIGGCLHIMNSFIVEDCPHFKADRKRKATIEEIGEIVGKSARAVQRRINYKGVGKIEALLKEKGYKLYVYRIDKKNSYYIEQIK